MLEMPWKRKCEQIVLANVRHMISTVRWDAAIAVVATRLSTVMDSIIENSVVHALVVEEEGLYPSQSYHDLYDEVNLSDVGHAMELDWFHARPVMQEAPWNVTLSW